MRQEERERDIDTELKDTDISLLTFLPEMSTELEKWRNSGRKEERMTRSLETVHPNMTKHQTLFMVQMKQLLHCFLLPSLVPLTPCFVTSIWFSVVWVVASLFSDCWLLKLGCIIKVAIKKLFVVMQVYVHCYTTFDTCFTGSVSCPADLAASSALCMLGTLNAGIKIFPAWAVCHWMEETNLRVWNVLVS